MAKSSSRPRFSPPPPMRNYGVTPRNEEPLPSMEDVILTDRLDLSSIATVRAQRVRNTDGEVSEGAPAERTEYFVDYQVQFDVDVAKVERLRRNRVLTLGSTSLKIVGDRSSNSQNDPNNTIDISDPHAVVFSALVVSDDVKQALRDRRPGSKVRVPVYLTFKDIQKSLLDECENLRLQFDFTASRNPIIAPVEMPDLMISPRILYGNDKTTYFTVRRPIEISVSFISPSETLIKISKSPTDKATGVKIYRRKIPKKPAALLTKMPTFIPVADINFDDEASAIFSQGRELVQVDEEVDNGCGYIYRAVPRGFDDAKSLCFFDFVLPPQSQGDVIMGERSRVIPLFRPDSNNIVTDYFINDDNYLSPDEPVARNYENIKLIARSVDEAIKVSVYNLGRRGDATVVFTRRRRDLTNREKKFKPVETNPVSTSIIVGTDPEAEAYQDRHFMDPTVVDSHVYEYCAKVTDIYGSSMLTEDNAIVEHKDPKVLGGEGILVTTQGRLTEGNGSIQIDTDIIFPRNVFDYLQSITRTSGNNDVFLGDFINGREDLNILPYLIIERYDTTTGTQRQYQMLGSDASLFTSIVTQNRAEEQEQNQNLAVAGEGPLGNLNLQGLGGQNASPATIDNNVFKIRFADRDIRGGHSYFYEVRVCVRDPLSVDANIVKTVTNQLGKFLVQPCKVRNPLFLRRGILPPTAAAQNFIRQEDIQNGPRRLLNRFTPKDEYELGEIGPRSLFPQDGMITVPVATPSVKISNVQASRPGFSMMNWSLSGKSQQDIDYFEISATDEYTGPGFDEGENEGRSQTYSRTLVLHLVPNDHASEGTEAGEEAQSYFVEDRIPILTSEDAITFGPNIPDPILLQHDVDNGLYGISRTYSVTPVYLDGSRSKTIESRNITVKERSVNDIKDFVRSTPIPNISLADLTQSLIGSLSIINGIGPNTLLAGLDRVGGNLASSPAPSPRDALASNFNMGTSIASRSTNLARASRAYTASASPASYRSSTSFRRFPF